LRRKTEDVSGTIDPTVVLVQRSHAAIAHDRDTDGAPRTERRDAHKPARETRFNRAPSGVADDDEQARTAGALLSGLHYSGAADHTLRQRDAVGGVRLVSLHDLLHETMAHDVAVVEIDERDPLDIVDDLHRLDQT
jgi:hypothetical protein